MYIALCSFDDMYKAFALPLDCRNFEKRMCLVAAKLAHVTWRAFVGYSP